MGLGLAVYVVLVDQECIQYDKPCWVALPDGEVEPIGEQPYLQVPQHQVIDGDIALPLLAKQPECCAVFTWFEHATQLACKLLT